MSNLSDMIPLADNYLLPSLACTALYAGFGYGVGGAMGATLGASMLVIYAVTAPIFASLLNKANFSKEMAAGLGLVTAAPIALIGSDQFTQLLGPSLGYTPAAAHLFATTVFRVLGVGAAMGLCLIVGQIVAKKLGY